jgi:hypothetical protein
MSRVSTDAASASHPAAVKEKQLHRCRRLLKRVGRPSNLENYLNCLFNLPPLPPFLCVSKVLIHVHGGIILSPANLNF